MEAENGGLGVFAHEYGHDLGLPDFYDTNGGENSTAFWTLMSSGSWLNHGKDDIGTTPGYFQALGVPLRQGRLFTQADRGEKSDGGPGAVTEPPITDALGTERPFSGHSPERRSLRGSSATRCSGSRR